jgi:hypothetical protein
LVELQPESSKHQPAQMDPVHNAPAQLTGLCTGQVAELPLHADAGVAEQRPPGQLQLAAGPQVAPGFPAGCWQVVDTPLQRSLVHGLPSSGHAAPALPAIPCEHVPPVHWSSVHGLPSSVHGVPSVFGGVEQTPFAGLQMPAV